MRNLGELLALIASHDSGEYLESKRTSLIEDENNEMANFTSL